MSAEWVAADACTLPSAEQPMRVAEFDEMFTHATTVPEELGSGALRITLTGPVGLAAQVADLTAREKACCSFFTFTLTSLSDTPTAGDAGEEQRETLFLDVAVPTDRADLLRSVRERVSPSIDAAVRR